VLGVTRRQNVRGKRKSREKKRNKKREEKREDDETRREKTMKQEETDNYSRRSNSSDSITDIRIEEEGVGGKKDAVVSIVADGGTHGISEEEEFGLELKRMETLMKSELKKDPSAVPAKDDPELVELFPERPELRGLKRKVITQGEQTPPTGSKCLVRYVGYLEDGTVFDSTAGKASFGFTLGQGEVLLGWDLALPKFGKGEDSILVCSPDYAYGAMGCPPRIPPNSTIYFRLQLIDFTPPLIKVTIPV